MKIERIYMIPVNDAYHSACACPLCALKAKVEEDSLDYYLGPSLMEPDTRVLTNSSGFCGDHLNKMFGREINRLGMGLMLHTHIQDVKKETDPMWESAAPDKRSLLKGKDPDYRKRMVALADKIDARLGSCIICDKINKTMARYKEVILWQYFEDDSFRETFSNKTYHCLPHVAELLRDAATQLNQNQSSEFVSALCKSHNAGLDELIKDVEWFTLKFDYRNKDKSWGNSKDAVPRAIAMLGGDMADAPSSEKEKEK